MAIEYKIGWFADDLEEKIDFFHDKDDINSDYISGIAKDYAESYHQIDEDSDMEFTVFVLLEEKLYEVNFKTEFEPVYSVDSIV